MMRTGRRAVCAMTAWLSWTAVVLVAFSSPVAAQDCDALGISGRTREEIEQLVEQATTTVDIGLFIAGGVMVPLSTSPSDLEGVFHLALSGGVTYALGLDVDRYCDDPDAPLPPGLGWQILVASNDFTDIELGALVRYHGELDLLSPDILLELGGLYRIAAEAQDAPGVLLSVGYGTQLVGALIQGQLLFDDDLTAILVAGVRLDAYLFRLLF